jgi:hypothetical protein
LDLNRPHDLLGWTPIRVSFIDGSPSIDWCNTEGVEFTDPFFDFTVQRCFRHPFRLLFRKQTSIEAAGELVAQHAGLAPSGFVFHTSRCGSTLVMQMLARLRSVLSLSEPGPVDAILRARATVPALAPSDEIEWVRSIIGAMGQPRTAHQRHLVIKLDAWAIFHLDLISAAFPGVPWVFLYRDPVEVLASHSRTRGMHMLPGVLPPELFELDPEAAMAMSHDEYSARVLGSICQAALRAIGTGGGKLVNYDELPAAALDAIPEWFGIERMVDQRALMADAARLDAKNPVMDFDPAHARSLSGASDALRAAAAQWVEPYYDVLETIRRSDPPADRVTIPRALRLPLTFDAEALAADVASLRDDEWTPHFNTRDYDGDWSGIALRSVGGRSGMLYPDPSADATYADTDTLARCPGVQATLAKLRCPVTSVRFLRLAPGARIKPHRDYKLSYAEGEVRLHVPVITEPTVEFRLDGELVVMQPGECWYLDLDQEHSVTHDGRAPRTHLVIDCVVDEWLSALVMAGVA